MAGNESPKAPEELASDALRQQLGIAQARVRALMREFNIPSGQLHAMAHAAEQLIIDTGLRADFLLALIDLHTFGREAKRRNLLPASAPGGQGQPVIGDARHTGEWTNSNDGTRLDAPQDDASDSVAEGASRDFFAGLDQASEPRVPMFSNRGQS